MANAFVAVANGAGNATSVTVNKPTGTVADDLMVAFVAIRNDAVITPPSGWTLVSEAHTGGGIPGIRSNVYTKLAGASEPSSYAWSWTGQCPLGASILTYRGVDLSTPMDVSPTQNADNLNRANTLTTVTAGAWAIAFWSVQANISAVPGSPWNNRVLIPTTNQRFAISDASFASPGATGNQDITATAGPYGTGHQVALRPAGVAVPPSVVLTRPLLAPLRGVFG